MVTDYTDHSPQKGTRGAKEFSIYDFGFTIWNTPHASRTADGVMADWITGLLDYWMWKFGTSLELGCWSLEVRGSALRLLISDFRPLRLPLGCWMFVVQRWMFPRIPPHPFRFSPTHVGHYVPFVGADISPRPSKRTAQTLRQSPRPSKKQPRSLPTTPHPSISRRLTSATTLRPSRPSTFQPSTPFWPYTLVCPHCGGQRGTSPKTRKPLKSEEIRRPIRSFTKSTYCFPLTTYDARTPTQKCSK
jgi:hypothetical protein